LIPNKPIPWDVLWVELNFLSKDIESNRIFVVVVAAVVAAAAVA